MKRVSDDFPWSFPLAVAQLPEAGQHLDIEASAAQREAIAAAAGLNAVNLAIATFDVLPRPDAHVVVRGRVSAKIVQTCVVTLDPVENDITEEIDLEFVPASEIPAVAKSVQKEDGDDAEIPDMPEPIVNGVVDLGHLANEFLVLGIDPYPRKEGAVFDLPQTPADPDEHPFAALKALKDDGPTPRGKKPKGN